MPPPCKRPGTTAGAPPPAVKAAAGACERVVANAERAVMPKQPTDGGRTNLCWVSPVVAVAAYYHAAAAAGGAPVTVESVIALNQGGGVADEAESAEDVLWEEFRIGTVACQQRGEDWDPWDAQGDADVWFNGLDEDWRAPRPGMLVDDWGVEKVSEEWFGALRRCIDAEHVALLLVERLEVSEAQAHAKTAALAPPAGAAAAAATPAAAAPAQPGPGACDAAQPAAAAVAERVVAERRQRPTHYLLVLGYRVQGGRRGSKNYRLFLKDPMEADRLVTTANLEAAADGKMVLATTREDGGVLDRFRPLQCCHFSFHGPSPARCPSPCDAIRAEGAGAMGGRKAIV
jgi:hypothetical protein